VRARCCSVPRATVGIVFLSATHCASINPVLAPTRVLAPGARSVTVGSGYAAPVVAPEARAAAMGSADLRAAAGTLAYAQSPQGLGPYVVARFGLPIGHEFHVGLVGHAVRAGVRKAVWHDRDETWSAVVGVQTRGSATGWGLDGALPGLRVDSAGLFGADVHAALGRTNSGLYDAWLGARVGYTHGWAALQSPSLNAGSTVNGLLHRAEVGLSVGLRVGFGRVAALAELEANVQYCDVSDSTGLHASVAGFSLLPATALSFSFGP